jgi:hypothetical protein
MTIVDVGTEEGRQRMSNEYSRQLELRPPAAPYVRRDFGDRGPWHSAHGVSADGRVYVRCSPAPLDAPIAWRTRSPLETLSDEHCQRCLFSPWWPAPASSPPARGAIVLGDVPD